MKGEIGIGWPLMLMIASGLGYGWKGVTWSLVGMGVFGFIVFPVVLAIARRISK